MAAALSPPASRIGAIAGSAGVAAVVWLGYVALSLQVARPPQPALGADTVLAPCLMGQNGYLRGRLHGSADLDIDWTGDSLACTGNARPNGAGLRLFFAGAPGVAAERLVFVIGIDGEVASLEGTERPANVTLIDEASSQFFHSGEGRCFTDVSTVTALPGERYAYRVEGTLWCVGAIAAVAGTGSVTLGDIAYAGRLVLE